LLHPPFLFPHRLAPCASQLQHDLDLLSLLTHLHSSLPSPSQQRINSLYTLDALLRACRSSIKKGKSTEIGGLEGSCAGFILLVEGWLEELVGGMGRGEGGGVWKEGAVSRTLISIVVFFASTFLDGVLKSFNLRSISCRRR
jgi:hypothetical protein